MFWVNRSSALLSLQYFVAHAWNNMFSNILLFPIYILMPKIINLLKILQVNNVDLNSDLKPIKNWKCDQNIEWNNSFQEFVPKFSNFQTVLRKWLNAIKIVIISLLLGVSNVASVAVHSV